MPSPTVNGKGLGWKGETAAYIDGLPQYTPGIGLHVTPGAVDLRKFDTPIKDQGNLGACTSFMITGLVKFVRNVTGLPPMDLSELFVYYNERVKEGTVNQDSGASIEDAFAVVETPGACQESDWPYDIAKFTQKPPAKCYTDAALDVATQEMALDGSLDSIRQCLAEGFPVGCGFDVYASFRNIGPDGIMPVPQSGEDLLGGHAVVYVGYDDASQLFIVRNSWGLNFGAGGYFYMPYTIVTNGMASVFMTVRAISGGVTPVPVPTPTPTPVPTPNPPQPPNPPNPPGPAPNPLEPRVAALEAWRKGLGMWQESVPL